ncbi:uncharacterized protein LOC116845398 isoform X1 [Odontomachus brunneus]|uniref:uncharacterized protein LOC116845398 isoform X1 n=1 Tax=Odontomachus brunneus TaxID=486640 RepID=UPI0013F21CF1|nr:uncharacterized protein LOC116845398 isoform X1 [Odontomachus brunneus]
MEDSATSSILLIAKIGAMIGLGFGSLALGALPLMVGLYRTKQLKKRRRAVSNHSSASTSTSASNASSSSVDSAPVADSQGLLKSLLLCFGGGVLLYTTFLHLAPEVRASVERHQSNGQLPTLGTLSLAELLFCGGFFLVYLVEEAVHAALTSKPDSSEALLYRTVSVRRCNNSQTGPSTAAVTNGSITTMSTTRSTWKDTDDPEENEERAEAVERPRLHPNDLADQTAKDDKVLPAIFVLSPASLNMRHQDVEKASDPELAVPELSYPRFKHHEHGHQHGALLTQNTSVQGLLTVLALSFHAIFEGLAVGLEPSISSVVYLAAAIATHKLVISFCVGMELYAAGASTRTTLAYLSIFSMVTPIGIAVGLALGHFKNDSENLGPTPTILQGMAAGTLLYVVFFEVLARERANEKSGLLQLVAIIVGFTLMLGLQIVTAHSHSHSHGSPSPASDHGHGHDHHDHDHDHEKEHRLEDHPSHRHSHDETTVLAGAIDKVTENIVEALSSAFTSSTTSSPTTQQQEVVNANDSSLHPYS